MRVCASFRRRLGICTCRALIKQHFLGGNSARKCTRTYTFIPRAPPTRLSNNKFSTTCYLFVLLTSTIPRSLYLSESEVLTALTGNDSFTKLLGHHLFWGVTPVAQTSELYYTMGDHHFGTHHQFGIPPNSTNFHYFTLHIESLEPYLCL